MKALLHWSIQNIFAAGVTVFLFIMMMLLIRADFKPEQKSEIQAYEINPLVEDEPVIDRLTIVAPIKAIVPPPPPTIERQQAQQPSVEIATIDGAIPVFTIAPMDKQVFDIPMADRDVQPLIRIGPIMPVRAEKSGHCKLRFSVSPQGVPFQVSALYCTSKVFESSAVKSVGKWKYQPKIKNGLAVVRKRVETKIIFILTDERGRPISE